MKIKYFTYAISATAILLCSIFQISLHAQSLDDENVKIMSRMDTESFKGKVVLNKAIVLEHQLEPFRKHKKDAPLIAILQY
ncbi:hypothetical protein [Dyadobacter sp. 32]|uniref:hypothetical protein n=1 Tax=Dyadobacter sp. 32 TaxID=538966 RepID=UPI0011EFA164